MSKSNRKHEAIYEELMRNAEERRRVLVQRALEQERKMHDKARARLAKARDEAGDTVSAMIARIDRQIAKTAQAIERTSRVQERIFLKAEIAHLRDLRDRLTGKGGWRRKPPESGIPVPAVPPHGPLPKQGGAAAPLDFERD